MKRFAISIVLLLLIAVPVFAQGTPANPSVPFSVVFGGVSYDSASTPNISGVVGGVIPTSENTGIYTAANISPVPGKKLVEYLNTSNLKYDISTGPIIKVWQVSHRVSLWGLAQGGLSAVGTVDGVSTGGMFAAGGFLDIYIQGHWGLDIVMPYRWDDHNGSRFAPTMVMRYKF